MDAHERARVLVVDDHGEMADVIAEVLHERGYEAVPLSSGRIAIDRLRRERFDAVVTDLRMPEIDGLHVLAVSRELDPSRPVIIMTGHAAMESALVAFDRGAYRYITKPFRLAALADLLAEALGAARVPSSR